MDPAHVPLTWSVSLTHWQWDTGAVLAVIVLSVGYGRAWRRCEVLTRKHAWCFGIGVVWLAAATMSVIGVYAGTLFWVRALQVLLLLFVIPFFLAMGRPVTALRMNRAVTTPAARVLFHPTATSVAMLATPWLLYLTPWYVAALRSGIVGAATRLLLLLIGFGYFYARLQADPVPRRYSQLISLVISIVESIGDGLLGIVLWLGPLIAADYYAGRQWGPSMRVDQSIGAGILWIVGDVLGVSFIIVLMRLFSADERERATAVDAELEMAEAPSGLWWEHDPQLRDRMGRR
ncbi:putative membrane protein [Mycobacterium sp. JS623]|uniref:cytochrome c oxidase assembly protein n=1 Tax=Mycobacterium sp. JS623 TaxID=212767 RepID=UPI0002A5AEAC|nr:cytochrome c oxidase assembly protein [Mycobacterium sp. JS623]AGB20939.1 putative membrane protein [Mycobacterium sp. JS623]